jgi:UDP-N-acetylmuramoyl-tripeptide--D-alanyl-D-alanine ligase
VGTYAKERTIEQLWTVGAQSGAAAQAHGAARHFEAMPALLAALAGAPDAPSIVVKGSRFMKMEQVVAALLASLDDTCNGAPSPAIAPIAAPSPAEGAPDAA